MKLAAELARPDTGKTLYILDEPTTGLHLDDIRKLLEVIHRLADLGNTVVVIEHNLEVIKTADWILDLGPEAGLGGGELVAEGPPAEVAQAPAEPHRQVPPRPARGRPLRRAAEVRPQGRRQEGDRGGQGRPGPGGEGQREGPTEGQGPRIKARPRPSRPRRPPGRSTAASGIPRTGWRGTAGRRGGMARSSTGSSSRVEALADGGLAPTNWSERGVVRIDGLDKDTKLGFPFLHATTSGEWVVTLRFFVPRSTFRANAVEGLLKLVPFHESPTPVLSDAPRVKIETLGPYQEIVITGHSAAEFETLGFEAFLGKAVAAYLGREKAGKLKKASEL